MKKLTLNQLPGISSFGKHSKIQSFKFTILSERKVVRVFPFRRGLRSVSLNQLDVHLDSYCGSLSISLAFVSAHIRLRTIVLWQTEYNSRYFNNPEEYRLWRDNTDSEAFSAFSILIVCTDRLSLSDYFYCIGPRTCIGREFETTEVVCFLTYKVEPLLQVNETKEQWKTRS